MLNPFRLPATVEHLLSPHKTPRIGWAMITPAYAGKEYQHLRKLCDQMVTEILEEPDDTRIGNLDQFIDEAHDLAESLGFPDPPVERVQYNRDEEPAATNEGRWPRFGDGLKSEYEVVMRHKQPQIVVAFGYRFHDPEDSQSPAAFFVGAFADPTDTAPGGDPLARNSKTEHREIAAAYIRRWIRLIDSVLEHAPEIDSTIPAQKMSRHDGLESEDTIPQYVTLDQMAGIVNRSKRTLEKAVGLPKPAVRGGGGKPNEWIWTDVRPWLEQTYGRKLPEAFPAAIR